MPEAMDNLRFVQLPGEHPQVVLVFGAGAEELSNENVAGVHQVDIQLPETAQRMQSRLPTQGKVMRLEMRDPQAEAFGQFLVQLMVSADFDRHLVNNVDVFCRA